MLSSTMNIKQIIRTDIAVSAVVHLTLLAGVFFFTEVHPFRSVTETIAVDIVTPEQVPETKPDPPPVPKPQDVFDFSINPDPLTKSQESSSASATPSSAAQQPPATQSPPSTPTAATQPRKQAAVSQPPDRRPAAALPPASAPPQPQTQPLLQSAAPTYVPPEPDVSVKYHVMLGLPQDRPGDGFDAAATAAADVESGVVAEFRKHLRTCSKLPASVAASDKVSIKLRVLMTLDGRLAADPQLIEASASMKGPALMKSAIAALQDCQPYTMLPQDKYGEWKMLDLNFTPRDFSG